MFQIENQVPTLQYKDLPIKKLASEKGCETVLILIEKGYSLEEFQPFNSPAEEKYSLSFTDSKLLDNSIFTSLVKN